MTQTPNNLNANESALGGVWTSLGRESLSWVGIAGSIVTLLTGIQDFIKLASWAATLVDNFSQVTLWLWSKIFFFLPKLTPLAGWFLNLVAFFVAVGLTSVRWGGAAGGEPPRSPVRDALVGLGIVTMFGLAISSLMGLQTSGALAASDAETIRALLNWLGSYLPKSWAFVAGLLLVLLPLVLLMNALGWGAHFFGGVVDQRLALSRIWRINFGVLLVLALSWVSKVLAPSCAPGGALAWLCG